MLKIIDFISIKQINENVNIFRIKNCDLKNNPKLFQTGPSIFDILPLQLKCLV